MRRDVRGNVGGVSGKMSAMRVVADEKRVAELIGELAERVRADVFGVRGGGVGPDVAGNVGEDARGKVGEVGGWAIVGVRDRGDEIARRMAAVLKPDHFGILDITLYRDDLSEIGPQPVVGTTEIDFGVDGMTIVLVDDVLMSGRSVRAALQSLLDLGRPKRVWLSVLVDRGGRELPIAADHVGLDLSNDLQAGEWVEVQIKPMDGCDAVVVRSGAAREGGVKAEARE